MISQTMGDRYELVRHIGSGGSARVYLARDRVLQRHVAIKVLHEEGAQDPIFVKRFKREAQSAARLSHPNIVSVYDWGEQNGAYFLVMEPVAGRTLKEEIALRGPLPEDEALVIGGQIASALEAAHKRGVVHRDVKPQNILLDESGRAKVVDFGIAQATGFSQLTATNFVCGTAHYISPEQARGRTVDERSDIYSLGAVLWEMLVGREIFGGGSMIDIALRHVNEEPPPLGEVRPGISPQTETVVRTALAKDPALRYTSAGMMLQALEQARRTLRAAPTVPDTATSLRPSPRSTALPPSRRRFSPPAEARPSRRAATKQAPSRALVAAVLAIGLLLVSGIGFLAAEHAATQLIALRPTVGPHHLAARTATSHHRALTGYRSTSVRTPSTLAPRATALQPTSASSLSHPAASSPVATSVASPTPIPPTPPAVALFTSRGDSPSQAVRTFYSLVDNRQFEQAAQLWTTQMQQRYAPSSALNGRFSGTRQISLVAADVLNQQPNSATVGVDVVEVKASGREVQWIGTWNLVREEGRWLLNSPNLHQG